MTSRTDHVTKKQAAEAWDRLKRKLNDRQARDEAADVGELTRFFEADQAEPAAAAGDRHKGGGHGKPV